MKSNELLILPEWISSALGQQAEQVCGYSYYGYLKDDFEAIFDSHVAEWALAREAAT